MTGKQKAKKKFKQEITNFYELKDVQKLINKRHNPNYNYHKISIEMKGCVIGSSGSGKTQTLLQILSDMPNTFNKMYIYTKAEEPLYNYLIEKIPSDLLTISYDLNDLRKFKDDDYYGSTLVVFDDMVNEKDQQCIQELYIRGRKLGVSMLYLSQSFFKIPKLIRLQCDYCFIVKVPNMRDLNLILSEFSLGTTKEQLQNMYKYVISQGFGNFFLIDMKASQNSGLSYRKNFITGLNPEKFL
jgi:ABC-type dipeptide/oligopeptide/nickel transport system ATPase component